MQILPNLLPLLASNHAEIQHNAIVLLRMLSQHSANQAALTCDEVLRSLGKLLLTWKTDPVIVGHAAFLIKNLSLPKSVQRIIESPCLEGLIRAVCYVDCREEESLCCVTSCLAELMTHEGATVQMLELIDEPLISCLVRLADRAEQTELAFQAAFIIRHIIQHEKVVFLLKSHMSKVEEYLMKYLVHREIRFQHLGLSTLCLLQKDFEFSSAFSLSPLKKCLDQVHKQAEEMQELLMIAVSRMDI